VKKTNESLRMELARMAPSTEDRELAITVFAFTAIKTLPPRGVDRVLRYLCDRLGDLQAEEGEK